MKAQHEGVVERDGLARLVEMERRLEARLVEARQRAGERIRVAETEAGAAVTRLNETLADELAELESRIECEHRQRIDSLLERTERQLHLFRPDPATVHRLAAWVARQILGETVP